MKTIFDGKVTAFSSPSLNGIKFRLRSFFDASIDVLETASAFKTSLLTLFLRFLTKEEEEGGKNKGIAYNRISWVLSLVNKMAMCSKASQKREFYVLF